MLLSDQIELAAWEHEARGPHGEWIKGPASWKYSSQAVFSLDEDLGQEVHHPEYGAGRVTGVSVPRGAPMEPLGTGKRLPSDEDPEVVATFGGKNVSFKYQQQNYAMTHEDMLTKEPVDVPGLHYVPERPELDGPLDDYTGDEIEGIHDYLGPDENARIASYLRTGKVPADYTASLRVRQAVEDMDAAEQRHALAKDTTFWRGIAVNKTLAAKMKPGKTFTDKNFVSMSTSQDWADEFAHLRAEGKGKFLDAHVRPRGGTPVRVAMHLKAGQHVMPGQGSLGEYILPRGTTFHVDSVSPDGTSMDLSVVPPAKEMSIAAWEHELRGPGGRWARGPGSEVDHAAYGHGVVSKVSGRAATVQFSDGTERQFGSLMEHEPVGEDKYFKAQIGPTGGITPDPTDPYNPDKALSPEIPSTDEPWGPMARGDWRSSDQNMVPYTTKGNAALEASLRRGEQPAADVEAIDRTIAKRHLTKPTVLYRGIGLSPELRKKFTENPDFSDKSYTSTTTAPEWADEFAHFRINGTAPWANREMTGEAHPDWEPARMILHAPAGQEIGPGEPGLAEYVLPRDSRFHIRSISTGPDGMTQIHADVLPHGEHAPLTPVDRPDPRERFLQNRRVDKEGRVMYNAGGTISGQIELGFRYNPLEHRNAHGEWSRDGSTAMGKLSGMKFGEGKKYKDPPADRIAGNKAKASDSAFVKKYGLSSANIVSAYDDSNEDERDQGMRWYADAHTVARMIGGGDADKGAALLSVYSPQTDWQTNALNAAHAMEFGHSPDHGTGITGSVKAKANAVLARDHGPYDDLFPAATAPKTNAFYKLIRNGGDTPDDEEGLVVMDRHALSVAAGRRLTKDQTDAPTYKDIAAEHPDWTTEQAKEYKASMPPAPVGSKYTYDYLADMYREAALAISRRDGIDIAPHQVQAITWLRQQRKNNEMDAALVAAGEELVKQGRHLSEIAGAKEAKGRASRASKAWDTWEKYAQGHTISTRKGTTAIVHENPISAANEGISAVIELRFDPEEPRDSRGRFTRFGGAREAIRVMAENREGFSVSPRTGQQPEHGYMVALDGHTHRYPQEILDDPKKLRNAIDDMLMSERKQFEGKDMYIGGWVEDGHLWLDPSQNVPDEATATRLGKERDQVGIFNLDTFNTINTGGSGGGRIIDHQLSNWQGASQGARGVLGPARGGAAGGSGAARGAVQGGIAGQLEAVELGRWGSDLEFLSRFHLRRGAHGKFESGGEAGALPARTRQSTEKVLNEIRASRRVNHPLNTPRSSADRSGNPDRPVYISPRAHEAAAARAASAGRVSADKAAVREIARKSGTTPGSYSSSSEGLEDATRQFSDGVKAFAANMNLDDAQSKQLNDLLDRQARLNKALAEAVLASQTAQSLGHQEMRRSERKARQETLRARKAEHQEVERAKAAEERIARQEKIADLVSERNSNFRIALGTALGGVAGFLAFRYGIHSGGEAITNKDMWEVVVPMIAATVGAAGPAFVDMLSKARNVITAKKNAPKAIRGKVVAQEHSADEDNARAIREVTAEVAQQAMQVLGLNEIEAAQFARQAMQAA